MLPRAKLLKQRSEPFSFIMFMKTEEPLLDPEMNKKLLGTPRILRNNKIALSQHRLYPMREITEITNGSRKDREHIF
jgi:hypothetical protein